MTREKGREGEGDGKVGKGRGGVEGRYVILGSESVQTLEGHPFPFVTLGSVLKTCRGTPLAICDFGF